MVDFSTFKMNFRSADAANHVNRSGNKVLPPRFWFATSAEKGGFFKYSKQKTDSFNAWSMIDDHCRSAIIGRWIIDVWSWTPANYRIWYDWLGNHPVHYSSLQNLTCILLIIIVVFPRKKSCYDFYGMCLRKRSATSADKKERIHIFYLLFLIL